MTTNSQLSITETKKQKQKQTMQTTRTGQIHRNSDHMEGYQQGGRGQRMGEKVQGTRSINGRYTIRWGG